MYQTTKIDSFIDYKLCHICNTRMVGDSQILLSDPPKRKYTCSKCDYSEYDKHTYGEIYYKETVI